MEEACQEKNGKERIECEIRKELLVSNGFKWVPNILSTI